MVTALLEYLDSVILHLFGFCFITLLQTNYPVKVQLQTDIPVESSGRKKPPCRKNPVESSATFQVT